MRDYSKVSPKFWIGATGKAIRKNGVDSQLLALYLLTGPHANMLGIYHLPVAYIVADTGIPFEGACKGLRSLSEVGFCGYDEATEMVFVYEMARYQIGEQLKPKDNQVEGVRREYRNLPENRFLLEFYERYRTAFHLEEARGSKAPPQDPSQAPCKPLRSQEQEIEQEIEQETEQERGGARGAPSPSAPAPQETISGSGSKTEQPRSRQGHASEGSHEVIPEGSRSDSASDALQASPVEIPNDPTATTAAASADTTAASPAGQPAGSLPGTQPAPQPQAEPSTPAGTRQASLDGTGWESPGSGPAALDPETQAAVTAAQQQRGSRLPVDFAVPEDWVLRARKLRPELPNEQVHTAAASFVGYWSSKPGRDGVKLNWLSAWLNWVRKERAPFAGGSGRGSAPGGLLPPSPLPVPGDPDRERRLAAFKAKYPGAKF